MRKIDIKSLRNDIKNILIIRRNNIGDMVCSIPVLRTIRREFPEAHITVLADDTNSGIVEGASFIDKLLVYKKGSGLCRNKYLNHWKLFRQNKAEFDLAIALKIGFSSTLSLITLLSGAKLRMGCVPEKWHLLQLCYNLPVQGYKKWKSIQQVDAFFAFIKTAGIDAAGKDMSIEIAPESKEKVRDFFKKNNILTDGRRVVFNISSNKPENTWPVGRFKETAEILSKQYEITFMITSAPGDKDKALRLSGDLPHSFYFETPKIMDFAALVAEADILICGEGGAMHIGAGVNTTTISLWGRSRPVKWVPYGDRQIVIKKGEHVDSISADDILKEIRENKLLRQ